MIDYTTETASISMEERIQWAKLTERFPAHTYVPTKPQAEFFREIGLKYEDTRIFLDTSGNGAGKTLKVINLVYNLVYENINIYDYAKDVQTGDVFNGFFNYPFFNNFPKDWPHEIWYISNSESLKTIIKRFREWGPKLGKNNTPISIIESKEGKSFVAKIEFPGTGWILYFKTDEQDAKTFEYAEVALVLFDEPPPLSIYRAVMSRTRASIVC